MAYFELDTTLTPETKAMHKEVANFARQVMRPAGIELDKLPDPADVIAKLGKRRRVELLWRIALDVASALDHIHSKGLIHVSALKIPYHCFPWLTFHWKSVSN